MATRSRYGMGFGARGIGLECSFGDLQDFSWIKKSNQIKPPSKTRQTTVFLKSDVFLMSSVFCLLMMKLNLHHFPVLRTFLSSLLGGPSCSLAVVLSGACCLHGGVLGCGKLCLLQEAASFSVLAVGMRHTQATGALSGGSTVFSVLKASGPRTGWLQL